MAGSPFARSDPARRTALIRGLLITGMALLAALALGLLLGSVSRVQIAPLLFIAAVIVTAWFAGFGMGLLAVAASTLLVDYFFIEPIFSLNINADDLPWFFAFILFGLVGLGLSVQRRRYEQDLATARAELEQRVLQRTAQLQLSEERWRRLFETSSVGIAITAPDGLIVSANQALQTLLDYDEPTLQQMRLADLLTDLDGRPDGHSEWRLRARDGRMLWVTVAQASMPGAGGASPLTSAVITDVTARRRATDDWQQAQIEMARVSRLTSLGVMAASIAHEVNQPLSAIVTNGQAAQRWLTLASPDLAEAAAAVERMIRDGHRAAEIIRSIRQVLAPAGLTWQTLSVNQLIRQVLPLLDNEMASSKVMLVLDLAPGPLPVNGDPVQLQQLLLNLLLNALEAMQGGPPGRRLLLQSRSTPGRLQVTVEDEGHGLDAGADSERLFDPFVSSKPQGMGVGLAICRHVVENHGGRIWAEPAEPRGARFVFTLPLTESDGTVTAEGVSA